MDFSLTREQEMIKDLAQQFAENELEPAAARIDLEHVFPEENFKKMASLGFTGIGIPSQYGGSGGGALEKVIAVSEFAKKCMTSAAILSIHLIAPQCIYRHGNEEQKQKYLPMITKGGSLGAFALTEPNAGSDAGSVKTTAIFDPETNEYILNGTKCFISGGSRADVLIVFALTQPNKGLKGMSAIIVEKGTPGFSVGKIEEKMGLAGSETAELIFEDCRVPASNLIGKEGEGFKIAMQALDRARIGIGAQAVGVAEGALELSIKYSKERVQFGKPIANLQGIQWYIADMATKTMAAKTLVQYAAYLEDSGKPFTTEAAMCKLNASENARFVTNLALQIHGGYGYMKDYPLERMYRDAKITEIYEGTSEIHKVVISRAVMNK
ncbi:MULTISPECIES: acryloyl-CoA reductase [Clostridium]|uniref:Acryloyl-CoA reductase (NADH) n=2 Tax=Clostridium TaxID=1485 RepID=A0A151ANC4_9CLOT|nr:MULTISPECIES: acryloyl-CoA reductase [Clostridium]KYH29132.1 acryloyl-CoA reductase (NADH) [Clostridium colicanis DSM 13634]MBE6043758.1 acyl-CoA dehydrogenase [Clostridium thermopalmarium]PRR73773.1 Acryloyl-CoA reductase [Clostridium thermopalmarium DSM 5974]PVZ21152.1 alkylation response protein AidB-like acyl-CoA dehydrogenase [Clostridium thermopalmarium DSM 5974]